MASCTFPSLKPPIALASMNEANVVDWIHLRHNQQPTPESHTASSHTIADRMLPAIVSSRMFLRPYLSESAPMRGDTRNCRVLMSRLVNNARVVHGQDARKEGAHQTACILYELDEIRYWANSIPSNTTSHLEFSACPAGAL